MIRWGRFWGRSWDSSEDGNALQQTAISGQEEQEVLKQK